MIQLLTSFMWCSPLLFFSSVKSRLLVKTSLKLLIVFVEYSESNSPRFISAVNAVDTQRGTHTRTQASYHVGPEMLLTTPTLYRSGVRPWSYIMDVLKERNGSDTELLMFGMTLINKVDNQKPAVQNLWLPR